MRHHHHGSEMNSPVLLITWLILCSTLRCPEWEGHYAKTVFWETQLQEQVSNGVRTLQRQPVVVVGPEPVVGVSFDDDNQIRELMKEVEKCRSDLSEFLPLA
jgi:hypothetical protein